MENKKYKKVSFPKFWRPAGFGNLPLSESLIKEEKHPCFIEQVEDPRQKPSGMTDFCYNGNDEIPYKSRDDNKWWNSGFTLIELLVVVLIIGILAAVAVPQYQKAVEKSRVTTLLSAMKTIADAQDAYYLANGEYSRDIDTLSVDMPAGSEKRFTSTYLLPTGSKISLISDFDNIIYGSTTRIQIDWILPHGTGNLLPVGVYCGANPADTIGISVCKSLGGQTPKRTGCSGFTQSVISCDFYKISL